MKRSHDALVSEMLDIHDKMMLLFITNTGHFWYLLNVLIFLSGKFLTFSFVCVRVCVIYFFFFGEGVFSFFF